MIAKVVVDVAVDREFDYRVPDELTGTVKVGSRVTVSFGPRRTQGYVVGLAEASDRAELKAIEGVDSILASNQIDLVHVYVNLSP